MINIFKSLFGETTKEIRKQKIIDACGCICFCEKCELPHPEGRGFSARLGVKFHFGIVPVPIMMKA